MRCPTSLAVLRRPFAAQLALGCLMMVVSVAGSSKAEPPKVTRSAGERVQKGQSYLAEDPLNRKRRQGWLPGLVVGGTFNLMDARNVVGQQGGTTVTLGAVVDAALEYNVDKHEWRNLLRASFGVTRTPTIDEFVKTNDGLLIESVYLLHLLDGFGPFVRFALNTQMFGAVDIRSEAVDYRVADAAGGSSNYRGRRLALSDPFQPLELKQSVGAFYQPVQLQRISIESRAGIGAQQIFADGALALKDDPDSAAIEVTTLGDNLLVGTEAVLNGWGTLDEAKRISYAVGASVLVPFATSKQAADDKRGLVELTSIETTAAVNVRLFEWASLGYKMRALRQPLLLDRWQIQNEFLLTLAAAFGSKAPAPKKACACKQTRCSSTDSNGRPPASATF